MYLFSCKIEVNIGEITCFLAAYWNNYIIFIVNRISSNYKCSIRRILNKINEDLYRKKSNITEIHSSKLKIALPRPVHALILWWYLVMLIVDFVVVAYIDSMCDSHTELEKLEIIWNWNVRLGVSKSRVWREGRHRYERVWGISGKRWLRLTCKLDISIFIQS